jgi:hypothetical protein
MSDTDGVLLDLDQPETRDHVVLCNACKHTLLRHLAAEYANHRAYREEWRP